ncbi:MAG: hypothetical protein ABJV68_05180 [Paracoccaceae bacterium]
MGTSARANRLVDMCELLEDYRNDTVTVSVKYGTRELQNRVLQVSNPVMHLDFISRVVGDAKGEDILALCDDPGVRDIEYIAPNQKDSTLHRLLEVYRVYHYVIGGRFPIAAVNFSQGVRRDAIGNNVSGERTMAEALDVVARRAAPVFVAAGNSGDTRLSRYAEGEHVFPVVAAQGNGAALFPETSRPDAMTDKGRLFLFADGAPRIETSRIDELPGALDPKHHLTLGQLLMPERSQITVGGSSFATFAATPTACLVHQYLQVVDFHLSAEKPVGQVQAQPFVSYYVDNGIPQDVPALKNRLADKRKKYAPIYEISTSNKQRFDDFFFGNTVEFNLRYSTPILRAFYRTLPEVDLAGGFEGYQRYVSFDAVLGKLRAMTFADWIAIAGNKRSTYFGRWIDLAQQDPAPLFDNATMDAIAAYCRDYTLFIILSDEAKSKF